MRKRILIVQSDADLAEALREGLSSTYTVEVAEDVSKALSAFERFGPNLILLDLAFPGGSGLLLLDFLNGLGAEAPPAILTGNRSRDPEILPFQHLVAAFLPKPFHLNQLRQQVDGVLTNWRPPDIRPVSTGSSDLLLVDPDQGGRTSLAAALREAGVQVMEAASFDEACNLLEVKRFDVVVSDWVIPGGIARSLVERTRSMAQPPLVIVLSGNMTPQFAHRALSLGVADVLPKPAPASLLLVALERIRFRRQETRSSPVSAPQPAPEGVRVPVEPRRSAPASVGRHRNEARYTFDDIIGVSPVMQRARTALQQVARMDSTVLLTGDTGSGKELFAQALHSLSNRRNGPFVAVNAAAIPEQLLESELFGYGTGAFTGAKREGHRGKFQMATGGTLFLDEIGDLPLALQAKLLRVLQEGEIDPVGGQGPQRIDVRLVAATHQDLAQMVRLGTFRGDLYFRLNVVNIHIPSLQERTEDIEPLAQRFLQDLCNRYRVPLKVFSPDSLALLKVYSWPGNVRELRNAVEQAFVFTPGETIYPSNLPPDLVQTVNQEALDGDSRGSLAQAERTSILRALEETHGNKARAARLLGISRAGLYVKLKVYGLA